MTRPVREAPLLSSQEYNRFSKGLYEWVDSDNQMV